MFKVILSEVEINYVKVKTSLKRKNQQRVQLLTDQASRHQILGFKKFSRDD